MKTFTNHHLRYETVRLETFNNWPIDYISKEDLSKNGFYYLRVEDHCACVFCRGIVGEWKSGDIPEIEHARHFGHCPFVTRRSPVGNIPKQQALILSKLSTSPTPSDETPPPNTNTDVCGSNEDLFSPVFSPVGPKRQEFDTYIKRLESYNGNWPIEQTTQTPEQLATAGFYYCGRSPYYFLSQFQDN